MSSLVYIQKIDGEIASDPCYAAWRGAVLKGYRTAFFDVRDLKAKRLPLAADTLVVGGMTAVHAAFRILGVAPPAPLNLPECLAVYRGRRTWASTWGDIHRAFKEGRGERAFVKPLRDSKAFTGYVVGSLEDLEPTIHLSAKMELLVSEVVDFVTEWRYFVHHHQIVGVAHYAGDPLRSPSVDVVRAAVADYASEAPVAYGIDFAVAADGRTLLVEANDALALGHYGLGAVRYVTMLEDRWQQLLTGGRGAIGPAEMG